jgi:serine/threonine protein kinase
MLDVDSPYIMKLYSFEEDEKYKYMVCEYCNGGDLLNYQAKQKNKVFTLDDATLVLSEVIRGLEYLHDKGYIHRDIKPQNILIKYEGEGEDKKPVRI